MSKKLLLVLALASAQPAVADFAYPPASLTIACTSQTIRGDADTLQYCENKVVPEVCQFWQSNGDFVSPPYPEYVIVWNEFCSRYLVAPNALLPPPPTK